MIQKTDRTTPSRYADKKMHYDEATVNSILDDTLFCTVSYTWENQTYAIPTSFVRIGDKLYIHGSVGSHFLRGIESGIPVCISAMIVDALVVAKSAFHHSANYRSVILFSNAFKVEEYESKVEVLKTLTEKIVPNSWDYLRPMTASEVKKTMVLGFEIAEASARMRTGMPIDAEEDQELPIWSGLIPTPNLKGTPMPDQSSALIDLPKHLRHLS